jgi:glycosyltransferase involved in cell wall biosynthesis
MEHFRTSSDHVSFFRDTIVCDQTIKDKRQQSYGLDAPHMAQQRLVYLVTEDWAFWRHRLPMARAAQAAGFDVHVIARISNRAEAIEAEGFTVHDLDLKRGSTSPLTTANSIINTRKLFTKLKPDLIHNVAIKPAIVGSAAATGMANVAIVNSINGLGSAFMSTTVSGRLLRASLERTLKILLARPNTRTIVQNPEDFTAVEAVGVDASQLILIPGSGVDTDTLLPLPEPPANPIRIAFAGRMIDDKGVRCLIRAFRLLRGRGENIELILAGEPDPENPTSISDAELASWNQEPGITWLGHVENIAEVWERAHIAILPSRGEGLPKSLLEAACFARPSIASDVPGCRQICIPNETGLLINPNDDIGLANAISQLANDGQTRRAMGQAARKLTVERFGSTAIGLQTATVYRELMAKVER